MLVSPGKAKKIRKWLRKELKHELLPMDELVMDIKHQEANRINGTGEIRQIQFLLKKMSRDELLHKVGQEVKYIKRHWKNVKHGKEGLSKNGNKEKVQKKNTSKKKADR